MKRIVIIGGGISGLATAQRLTEICREANSDVQLTILEASPRLGGTIQTVSYDGFLLERGPDSFISEKPEALALVQRLGLESKLIHTNAAHRRSFIVRQGRLRPVPEGFQLLAPSRLWPFLTSDIFSFAGKFRMAGDLFLPRRSGKATDDESLASFVKRRLGREALERMAQPMVGGIYTADPETLSLRATLPRFLDMELEHRSVILGMFRKGKSQTNAERKDTSGPRYSLFMSFDDGMSVIVNALANNIARHNAQEQNSRPHTIVRMNTRVKRLEREISSYYQNTVWKVTTDWGDTLRADAVCLAIPAHAAAALLEETSAELFKQLGQIKYASTATINLGYRRADINHPLDGFGFVVPIIENRSLIACSFSSVKFAGRAPDGHVLLRVFVGGALQSEVLKLDEEEMLKRVKADLADLLGIRGEPLFNEVATWPDSMPQYEVGHLNRVDSIDLELSNLPGLVLAGNSYRGAGIPDCIRSGETAARKIMDSNIS